MAAHLITSYIQQRYQGTRESHEEDFFGENCTMSPSPKGRGGWSYIQTLSLVKKGFKKIIREKFLSEMSVGYDLPSTTPKRRL